MTVMENKTLRFTAAALVSGIVSGLWAGSASAALQAHLTFDSETGGISADSSLNGNDATLTNGAAITSGTLGKAGEALVLDGADDFAQLTGYAGVLGNANRTTSLWVNTTVNQANGTFFMGWGDTGGGSQVRYDFGLQSGTTDRYRMELNAGFSGSSTGTTITDGTWHHLVAVWDSSTLTHSFYLDGAAYGTETEPAQNTGGTGGTNARDVVIGSGIRQAYGVQNLARWTDGMIDDVQIYDDALSVADVGFLFNNPGTAILPDLLTLQVDPVSGAGQIINNTGIDLTFDFYKVTSAGGSLDTTGWSSLGDQAIDAWEEAGLSDANTLGETSLTGETILTAGSVLALGNVYDETVDVQDLHFTFRNLTGGSSSLLAGNIEYVTISSVLLGDVNLDGIVDTLDIQPFVDLLAGGGFQAEADIDENGVVDTLDIQPFVDIVSGGSVAAANAVPEPTSLALIGLGGLALIRRRR